MNVMPSIPVLGCVLIGTTLFAGCASEATEESPESSNEGEFFIDATEAQLVAERRTSPESDVIGSGTTVRETALSPIEVEGIVVEAKGPLVTTEGGGATSLAIRLARAPKAPVVVKLSSQDTTEGVFAKSSLTFGLSNWSVFQEVVLRGVSDLLLDGGVRYGITLRTTSLDSTYSGKVLRAFATNLDGAVFHGLGDLPDGSVQSTVSDVSANGSVVVGSGTDGAGLRAVRWTPTGGMAALEGANGTALGVSPSGSFITGAVAAPSSYGRYSAALWNNGSLSILSRGYDITTCTSQSTPDVVWLESGSAVTDSGKVVGSVLDCGTGKHMGFLWNGTVSTLSSSVLSSIGSDGLSSIGTTTLPKMYAWGVLYGADPRVAGTKLAHPEPFYCPSLNPICQTAPSEMSFDGQVIVGTATVPPSTDFGIPTRWTTDGRGTSLPKHPADAQRCQALGVNGNATAESAVVVGSCTTNGNERAVLWRNGIAQTIEAALSLEGVTVTAGWRLLSAKAASSDGRVIVGNGLNPNGETEAWRAVLPGLLSLR
jgi:hypothetical protein